MPTREKPSLEFDSTRFTPSMPATASSMGLVTSVSTSSGEAPGYTVEMLTNGKSTAGNRSIPSRVIDTIPSTTKLRMNIVAKTGRLMEVSEIHMTIRSLDWLLDVAKQSSVTLHDAHAAAVHDLASGVGHNRVATLHTRRQHDALAVGQAFGNGHHRHDVALDAVDRAATVTIEHGFSRHDRALGGRGRHARGGIHAAQHRAAPVRDFDLDAEVAILRVDFRRQRRHACFEHL